MNLKIYQVDAFANQVFAGNPAAVCILDTWLPTPLMQKIAAEMYLPETAFVVKNDTESKIRWFTPKVEIDLCGHATIASAHVLYNHLKFPKVPITFDSNSGPLSVSIQGNGSITLDFPVRAIEEVTVEATMTALFDQTPIRAFAGKNLNLVFSSAEQVRSMKANRELLLSSPHTAVSISAPDENKKYDFVSRFFAPQKGIDEDPVTGSSYTELAPIYEILLNKKHFSARQVSQRGGNVALHLIGDRVHIGGEAITVMRGELTIPESL